MKKILALALAAVMFCTVFSGCGKIEETEKIVTGIVTELCYEDNFSNIPYGIEIETSYGLLVFSMPQDTDYLIQSREGAFSTADLDDVAVGDKVEISYSVKDGTQHVESVKIFKLHTASFPDEPPFLTLSAGNTKIQAMRGSYQWQTIAENGLAKHIIADGLHPLQAKEYMPCLRLSPLGQKEDTFAVNLLFDHAPTKITAEYYPVNAFGDMQSEPQNAVVDCVKIDYADGGNSCEYFLNIKNEGCIHVLYAEWGDKGSAEYSFYTSFSSGETEIIAIDSSDLSVCGYPPVEHFE